MKLFAFATLAIALSISTLGCSGNADAPSDSESGGNDEGALKTSGGVPCVQGGTDTMDGIEGSYELVGTPGPDELKTLTLSNVQPVQGRIESSADYHRTLNRECIAAGCELEDGTASLLPDNALITPMLSLTPAGQQPGPGVGSTYYLLGLKRENGAVAEMCLADVTKSPRPTHTISLRRKP